MEYINGYQSPRDFRGLSVYQLLIAKLCIVKIQLYCFSHFLAFWHPCQDFWLILG